MDLEMRPKHTPDGLRQKCISEGTVGQEFVTKFGKVIQIVSMSQRKVRVLVLATEEEVEVAPDYPVFEFDVQGTQAVAECEECEECEEKEAEAEVEVTGAECVEETEVPEGTEEGAELELEPEPEPKAAETVKMRVSAQPEKTEKLAEKPKPKKQPTKTAKKAAPKKKEAKTKKVPTSKPAGEITTKQLVVNLLMKGPQTRESLAQAVVDAKLSKNDSVQKVKSYISIILHGLKKVNKNFVSLGIGRYEIKQ